jgi:hypothetical protein
MDVNMRRIEAILDEIYAGQERVSRDEIYRRAVASEVGMDAISALDGLPEGEYSQDEITDALGQVDESITEAGAGVPANELSPDDLMRELSELHRTRTDTLRHGSDQALRHHNERTEELENEYLRRMPEREVDPQRLRAGARAR